MELDQEKIELIKRLITSNKKYAGNEDFYDDFFNETCKRSLVILKTIKNEASLEIYLKKIVTTAIVQVLKDSGRLQRTSEGFAKVEESSLDAIVPELSSSSPVSEPNNRYSNVKINYNLIDLSDSPEEITIKKEVLQKLYDAVLITNSSEPTEQYLELFNLRYEKEMKQNQIAQELNLSQSEVSKRLLKLMEKVKVILNND